MIGYPYRCLKGHFIRIGFHKGPQDIMDFQPSPIKSVNIRHNRMAQVPRWTQNTEKVPVTKMREMYRPSEKLAGVMQYCQRLH